MTLGELIERLEAADPATIVPRGWLEPCSDRGDYSDLAFKQAENVSVAQMLDAARGALGQSFEGWKGGDYTMHEWSTVKVTTEYGVMGEEISHLLLDYMLGTVR